MANGNPGRPFGIGFYSASQADTGKEASLQKSEGGGELLKMKQDLL